MKFIKLKENEEKCSSRSYQRHQMQFLRNVVKNDNNEHLQNAKVNNEDIA